MKKAETLEYCPISKTYKSNKFYQSHDLYRNRIDNIERWQYEHKMQAERRYIFQQSQKYKILKYRLWWFGAIVIIVLLLR